MSGFGRCGEWFAWQRHGEAGRPDLMTLAKGLTGAHVPLGAVVLSGRSRPGSRTSGSRPGLTYCGHPLACAAGLAALQAYEDEGLVERSRDARRADARRAPRRCRIGFPSSATCAAGTGSSRWWSS